MAAATKPHYRLGVRSCSFFAAFLASALALGACASNGNTFRDNYRSSLERWPSGEVSRLLPATGKVDLVKSKNIEDDATNMMENGYLLLGRSKFRSGEVDPAAAREVAADLGASVVLVKSEHAKTVVEAVPVERWMPALGGRGNKPDLRRPEMHGEFRMVYTKKPVDYFDFSATFWAKSKPPIFGVLVEGTGSETHQTDPSGHEVKGRGVVTRAVINESPAARSGVRRGDIIVRFAGTEITDPDQFFDTVVANKGREVDVEIVRVEGATSELKLSVLLSDE